MSQKTQSLMETEEFKAARAAAVAGHHTTTVFDNGHTGSEAFGWGYDAGTNDAVKGGRYWGDTGNTDWDAGYAAAWADYRNGNWS